MMLASWLAARLEVWEAMVFQNRSRGGLAWQMVSRTVRPGRLETDGCGPWKTSDHCEPWMQAVGLCDPKAVEMCLCTLGLALAPVGQGPLARRVPW